MRHRLLAHHEPLGDFALGVGASLRHTAGAITLVLAVLLAPVIALELLPEDLAEPVEKFALMGGGLAIQQTVDRPDNIPLGPGPGCSSWLRTRPRP